MTIDANFPILEKGPISGGGRLFGFIPRPASVPECGPGEIVILFDGHGRAVAASSPGQRLHGNVTSYVKIDCVARVLKCSFRNALRTTAGFFDVTVTLKVRVHDAKAAATSGGADVRQFVEPFLAACIRDFAVSHEIDAASRVVLATQRTLMKDVLRSIRDMTIPIPWLECSILDVDVEFNEQLDSHMSQLVNLAQVLAANGASNGIQLKSDGAFRERMDEWLSYLQRWEASPTEVQVSLALMGQDEGYIRKVLQDGIEGNSAASNVRKQFIVELMNHNAVEYSSALMQELFDSLTARELQEATGRGADKVDEGPKSPSRDSDALSRGPWNPDL